MYIKQIIIQGFKSYKNQTVVEPFSPKLNVIVGRNGSGKSNFFAAIRFVLGDAYSTGLSREERQGLIHEGSGSSVMSAYVELVIDNSDDRFLTGNDELVLRRTIGLKKDEYSLDRKNATRSDVMNVLEIAGFSRANPYFIVPQGRVSRITNMKDSERLDILKTVAGTQVFAVKKEESLKIMNETNNKMAAIDSTFEQISERLADLEEEQAELRNFQEQDAEKRAIEWVVGQRELDAVNAALEKIEGRREGRVDEAAEIRDRHNDAEDNVTRIIEQLEQLKQNIQAARLEKRQLEEERRERAKAKAQAELEVKNMIAGQGAVQRSKQQRDQNLQRIQQDIANAEQELDNARPEFEQAHQQAETKKTQLDSLEVKQKRLYEKQGRNARFRTKKERDDWLKEQIEQANTSLARYKATRMQTNEEIVIDQDTISQLENEIEQLRQQLSGQTSTQALREQLDAAKERQSQLDDERKVLWRKDAGLDNELSNAIDDLRKAERNLSHMMDRDTARGLESVRRIKQQHNLEGCYGTLAELIEVPAHHIAIEAVAGSSLFHYVVDTDETATRVLEQLNRERSGRLTFMPLNRLKPKDVNYPQSNDMRPVVQLMKFDQKYEKAVKQVFGKSIICQNLTVAAQYARTHGLNAVTPDGDRSDKKGALSGGYVDSRQSRIKATKAVMEARNRFEEAQASGADTKRKIEKINQTVTKALSEVQKLEQRIRQDQEGSRSLRDEFASKTSTLTKKREDLEAKQKQEAMIAANVKTLTEQQQTYQTERSSAFRQALTNAEQAELDNLTTQVQVLRQEYSTLASTLADVESRRTQLETRLNSSLRPQLVMLESEDVDIDSTSNSSLVVMQKELDRIDKVLTQVEKSIDDLDAKLEEQQTQSTTLEGQLDEARAQQEELSKLIARSQRHLATEQERRTRLTRRRQEINEEMRDLGLVSEELRSKYRRTADDKLTKQLHKLQDSLKKFEASGLNRHAVEHYKKSQKSKEELQQRRGELDKAKTSIQNLIDILDQRKDEAIERTFKQVSRAFAQIFSKLVPQGAGKLVIVRKGQRRGEDEESDDEQVTDKGVVESYIGVSIQVSFNSRHDDQQKIQQLSGGQKSLCALALIFAIQEVDPAPFTIFDEIDANLDAQYRTAVADHLKHLSDRADEDADEDGKKRGGQFICTTFRPEMLQVADKVYGVTFANNVSRISVRSRDEALDFVESQVQ